MEAKYVVVDNGGFDSPQIIIFPPFRQHKEMLVLGKIVSAGFVGRHPVTASGFYTYGESISLHLASRDEDQTLLDMLLKKQ